LKGSIMSKPPTMHVLGYERVSTEEQSESGAGLAAQRHTIEDAVIRRGWTVEWFGDPGKSGKYTNPGLRSALDLLAAGQADALVVTKMDRIARSAIHALEIIETAQDQGWALIVLDIELDMTTPAGRAMAGMLAIFAEFERDLISQRTKDAMAAKSRAGKHMGRPRLAPSDVVRRIVTARDAGLSFGTIARDLTADAVLSPSGLRTWQVSSVRRLYVAATKNSRKAA
jgi:DNA invertase Pin-like site-specific DNA recombinase